MENRAVPTVFVSQPCRRYAARVKFLMLGVGVSPRSEWNKTGCDTFPLGGRGTCF